MSGHQLLFLFGIKMFIFVKILEETLYKIHKDETVATYCPIWQIVRETCTNLISLGGQSQYYTITIALGFDNS